MHGDSNVLYRFPLISRSGRNICHRTALTSQTVSPVYVRNLVEVVAAICRPCSPGGPEGRTQARAQPGPLQPEVEKGCHCRETCGDHLYRWLNQGPVAYCGRV